MPTYLVHGYRWPRALIRQHIIAFDLEDAAIDWIVAPATAHTLLNSFYCMFDFLPPSQPPFLISQHPGLAPVPSPDADVPPVPPLPGKRPEGKLVGKPIRGLKEQTFNDWSRIKLLEQYDPDDMTGGPQPYAYVADYMVPVTLSIDITAEMAAYAANQRPDVPTPASESKSTNGETSTPTAAAPAIDPTPTWFRTICAATAGPQTEIGWYIVYCGDEERSVPQNSLVPFSSVFEADARDGYLDEIDAENSGEGGISEQGMRMGVLRADTLRVDESDRNGREEGEKNIVTRGEKEKEREREPERPKTSRSVSEGLRNMFARRGSRPKTAGEGGPRKESLGKAAVEMRKDSTKTPGI